MSVTQFLTSFAQFLIPFLPQKFSFTDICAVRFKI